MLSPQFFEIYTKAVQSGTEITLEKLISILEIKKDHILDQVVSVKDTLNLCKLEIVPDIRVGGLNTTRILRSAERPEINIEYVLLEIKGGETTVVEFKSSLMYDYKRAMAEPNSSIANLKSDEVTFFCLRTFAAFLTSHGGTLYVGVNKDGECIGIENDFLFLNQGNSNKDDWEVHIRNLISSRFKDGVTINNYIEARFIEIEHKTIASLYVQKRKKLSFLKKDKDQSFSLYCRQGNRTVEVKIDEIEELLEMRQNDLG